MLFISAAEFEVKPLRASLGANHTYLSCGIGSLNAAKHEAFLIEQCRGQDVVFLGTCGTLGDFKEVELVTVDRVLWLPPCERLDVSWSIEQLHPPIDLTVGPLCQQLPVKTLLTSPTIAKSSEIKEDIRNAYELKPNSELIENLELYCCLGIKDVAKTLNIILAITNQVCPEGRQQWRRHFVKAAELTSSFITKNITV